MSRDDQARMDGGQVSRLASRALHWGAASTAGVALLQVLQLAILARLLTPAEFGLAAMMAVAIGLATAYGDLGLGNAVLAHSPLSRRVLSSLYWVGISAGVLLAAAVIALAPLVAKFFSEPELTPLIRWAALGLAINPVGTQFQLMLQKELRFRPLALVDFPANALGVLVTVACAWRGMGVFSLVAGSLTGAVARAAAYFAIGIRQWPLSLECAPSEIRPLLSFGAFQLGERTVSYFARNLDKAAIGWLLGAPALGFYNTAYQLMQKPLQLVQPLATRIATPLYVRVRGDHARLVNAYLLTVELAASALFPAMALLAVLADPVVAFVLGDGWRPVTPILRWLSLLGCFYAIGFPLGSLLVACMRPDWSFWLNLWRLVPFTAAIFFGSHYGLVGVAIALVVAQALGGFGVGFWVRAKLGVDAMRFLRALMAPAAISLASGGIVAAWLLVAPASTSVRLAGGAMIFAAAYIGAFLLFREAFVTRVREHLGWSRGARGHGPVAHGGDGI